MTIDIVFRVLAEDAATAQIRKTTEQIKTEVGAVKKVGNDAKAALNLVGTISGQLGAAELNEFAGSLTNVADQLSKFKAASMAGEKASFAFKAGLVTAVATMSLKVGKAIGSMIFDIRDLKKELEESAKSYEKSFDDWRKNFVKDQDFELTVAIKTEDEERVEELKTNLEQLSEAEKNRIEYLKGVVASGEGGEENVAQAENQIKIAEERKAVIDGQLDSIDAQTGEYKKQLDFLDKQAAVKAKSAEADLEAGRAVNSLRVELEMQGKSAREIEIINLRNLQLSPKQLAEAQKLVHEKHNFIDAEKKSEELRAKKEAKEKKAAAEKEASMKRIVDLRKQTAESLQLEIIKLAGGEEAARSYQLQLQGLGKGESEKLASLEGKLKDIKDLESKSYAPAQALVSKDQRFGSGRAQIAVKDRARMDQLNANKIRDKLLSDLVEEMKIANKKPDPKPVAVTVRGS